MTKSELIKKLSEKFPNMLLREITQVVEIFFDEISKALATGQRVEIRGFGAFTTRKRKQRLARNPRTNEVVQLDERFTPYFRAGKELRDKVNNSMVNSNPYAADDSV